MGEITDRFDATMNNVVPLAMKKWVLDIENQKWQDQLNETKRQHNLNAGMEFVKQKVFDAAMPLLGEAGVNTTGLLDKLQASPGYQNDLLKQKSNELAYRTAEDKAVRMDALRKKLDQGVAITPGEMGDYELDANEKADVLAGNPVYRQHTPEEILAMIGESDPETYLKNVLAQKQLAQIDKEDELLPLRKRLLESQIAHNFNLARGAGKPLPSSWTNDAVKELTGKSGGGGRGGSGGGLVKAIDENGEVIYVPKSEAAGKRASTGITKKQLADAEAKITANADKEAVAPYVDLYNQANTGYKYEWKPGRLWGGEWVKKPASGSVSRPAAANAGAAGVIKWGRDANGNPVRIK